MKTISFSICAALLLLPAPVSASILDETRLTIDFTNQEDANAKATWSPTDTINTNDRGLGWDGLQAAVVESWIQTKPLAVGLSWRAATSVSLEVSILDTPTALQNPGDQPFPFFRGRMYARYSPDEKHWSTWQELSYKESKSKGGRTFWKFSGVLSVPLRERQEFNLLREEYQRLDVPWIDDEEAMVRWILAREPNFFERSLPFVGYVEFLYEVNFHPNQRITILDATAGFTLNGMTADPRDPEVAENRYAPWRFKAE